MAFSAAACIYAFVSDFERTPTTSSPLHDDKHIPGVMSECVQGPELYAATRPNASAAAETAGAVQVPAWPPPGRVCVLLGLSVFFASALRCGSWPSGTPKGPSSCLCRLQVAESLPLPDIQDLPSTIVKLLSPFLRTVQYLPALELASLQFPALPDSTETIKWAKSTDLRSSASIYHYIAIDRYYQRQQVDGRSLVGLNSCHCHTCTCRSD